MGKYTLVNPVIIGTFDRIFDATTADSAAIKFWEELTKEGKYITGNIPKFLFTLQDDKTKDLYHYKVEEKPSAEKETGYTITSIPANCSKNEQDQFLREVSRIKSNYSEKQSGGRRKRYEDVNDDIDDSDSDDLDDFFRYVRIRRYNRPIVYWWYTPSLYKQENIFTPTFVAPVSPYVQLWVPQ